jgi:hypothetical protein
MSRQQGVINNVRSDNLADILERVLDKGLVIAGDITIRLVDVELLTIQVRLLVASVDKAKELGINWWENNSFYCKSIAGGREQEELSALRRRIDLLEGRSAPAQTPEQG